MVELRDAQLATQLMLGKLAERYDNDFTELRDAQLATQLMLEKVAERHDKDITQLRDAQLVTQRLIELNEKKWDARFEKLTAMVEQFRSDHQNDVTELHVAISSLITNIDRLIQGRQPNGH